MNYRLLIVTNKKVNHATQKNKWSVCWSFLSTTYLSAFILGTNCAPLLADLFLFSYESEFLQTLVKNKRIKESRLFNFTFRYIDDVLSLNNPNFSDWVPLKYPPELDIKETTDTASSASFLDSISNFTYTVISVPESMTNETILILKL